MKKTLFTVLAIFFAISFLATSCNPDDPTKEELLTQKKGWKLTAATSDPAYLLDKEGVDVPITNLFDGYIYKDELDDIIYFKENKSEILNYGKDGSTCDGKYKGTERSLGNWELPNDNLLKFYFPAYDELLSAVVLTLDESTLKVSVKIAEDDEIVASPTYRGSKNASKTVRDYVFTLTYSIAK